MTTGSKPEPFDVTKYGRDRDQEIELNRFTHALEMEQLKLLILLNGGAATALLAFASHRAVAAAYWFTLAIVYWLLGVFLGAGATLVMRIAQSEFAQSLRHRRRAAEWRRFRAELPPQEPDRLVGLPAKDLLTKLRRASAERRDEELEKALGESDGAILNDAAVGLILERARRAKELILPLSVTSLSLFLAGAAAATVAILSAPTGAEAPSDAARNSAAH